MQASNEQLLLWYYSIKPSNYDLRDVAQQLLDPKLSKEQRERFSVVLAHHVLAVTPITESPSVPKTGITPTRIPSDHVLGAEG